MQNEINAVPTGETDSGAAAQDSFEAALFGQDSGQAATAQAADGGEEATTAQSDGAQEEETTAQSDGAQEETETIGDDTGQPAAGEAADDVPPQTMPLAFSGRTAQLGTEAVGAIAEALGMAPQGVLETLQKGMHFDAKNQREMAIIEDYATAVGMTLAEYIDALEQSKGEVMLEGEMNRQRAELPEDTPEEAIRRLAEASLAQKQQARQQQRTEQVRQQQGAEHRQRVDQWAALYAEHPELKTGELPEGLIGDVVARGCSPTEAYARLAVQQQKAEIAELQKQLAAEKQNNKNKQTAVGSMGSAGDMESDAFLDAFGKG